MFRYLSPKPFEHFEQFENVLGKENEILVF